MMHIAILPKDRYMQITRDGETQWIKFRVTADFPEAPTGYTLDPARPFFCFIWNGHTNRGMYEIENPPPRSNEVRYFYDPAILKPYLEAFEKEIEAQTWGAGDDQSRVA